MTLSDPNNTPGPPDRRGRLLASYATLIALVVVLVFLAEVWPRGRALDEYGPNLAAEIAGILITVVFVERLLAWQRDRQLQPLRVVALGRTRKRIYDLLSLLQQMYKAAADDGSPTPDEPAELIDCWDKWCIALDFNLKAPVIPDRSWTTYAAQAFTDFEREMLADLDRYAEALGHAYVVAVERLLEEPLVLIMKSGPQIEQVQKNMGVAHGPRPSLYVQGVDGQSTIRRDFGDRLLALIAEHEQAGGTPLRLLEGTWRHDQAPSWAEAQIQLDPEDPAPS